MISFFVDCVPPKTNHHVKRIVRVGQFSRLADKPELVQAKQFLEALLLPHRLVEPLRGPVALALEFTWPWRSTDSQKTRASGRIVKPTRPDCSNIAKTFEDRLVALRFLEDDGQVVQLSVSKWIGVRPGVRVTIEPVAVNGVRWREQARTGSA